MKLSAATLASAGLVFSCAASAHVEYYDLNQGAQIQNLTDAGRAASTAQYGTTPVAVLALNGPPRAPGVGSIGISAQQNLPLNDPALWNAAYQAYTGAGVFSGVVYSSNASAATVRVFDVTDSGWGAGTQASLGDSHKVGFFNFRLAVASDVSITWNIDDGFGAYIDAAFSVYRGVLPYQGHDDAADVLNPVLIGTGKVQNRLDDGTFVDAQGILSPLRLTTPGAPTYAGQFNALGDWSQANPAGNWSAIDFLQAANSKTLDFSLDPNDTLESMTIRLAAGNYTIAASGALGAAGSGTSSFGLTNLNGLLTFSALAVPGDPPPPPPPPDPVPLPPAAWLLASALAWLGTRHRRG
ncbi:MAG: hypothetical protein AB7Q97_04360 [Gammaproteobacteria bacterium]